MIARSGNKSGTLVLPVTLRGTVKKIFLTFKWNLMCFGLCLSPLILSLSTTEKSLAFRSYAVPSGIYTHSSGSLERSLPQAEQPPLPQPLPIGKMLQSLNHLPGPLLDSLLSVPCNGESTPGPSTPDISLVLSREEGFPPLTCW